jgi:hypothetical protein
MSMLVLVRSVEDLARSCAAVIRSRVLDWRYGTGAGYVCTRRVHR